MSMWSGNGKGKGNGDDDDDDDEEEDSSSEDSDDAGDAKAGPSREDRKAQKKARKEAALAKAKGLNVAVGDLPSSDDDDDDDDDDMPANPNHSKAARQQAAAPVVVEEEGGVDEITDGVKKLKAPANRRERESMEAAAAKEKYMRLHAQGKTDEAKADLARLRVIREQRAAEAARKQVSIPIPEPPRPAPCFLAPIVLVEVQVANAEVRRLRRKRKTSRRRLAGRRLRLARPRSGRRQPARRRLSRRNEEHTSGLWHVVYQVDTRKYSLCVKQCRRIPGMGPFERVVVEPI